MFNRKLSMLAAIAGISAMAGTGVGASGFPRLAQPTGREPLDWQRRREASRWNRPEIEAWNAQVKTRQVRRAKARRA